jgi:glycosyltransferase involved in cell wall biosynthesis
MTRWAVLTGEYPPQPGGVSDYTRLVAEGLASRGDEVVVYVPPHDQDPDPSPAGVQVRRLPAPYTPPGLRWLDRDLARSRPDRILVQYVPHAFGLKAMNLPFAAWVAVRARRVAPLWVMFHELAFPFVRRPLRHNLLSVVNRVMLRAIAGAAERVFVSVPGWGPELRQVCPKAQPAEWLPIPSTVATVSDPGSVATARSRYALDPSTPLVGHFGTFGKSITDLFEPALVELLRTVLSVRCLLIGHGSERYHAHIEVSYPDIAGRVSGTGALSPAGIASHLRACDLLLQPYPGGVCSRRSSVMAALANGAAVLSTVGPLTEPVWTEGPVAAVAVAEAGRLAEQAAKLLGAPAALGALGQAGARLYDERFALRHTLSALQDPARAVRPGRPASTPSAQLFASG